jgi:ABC-type multidrug transport system fused ATPase/permease subunit
VSFAYPDADQVLRDVSFRIGTNEHVALVGKSGSGKSTLSRLLARMADPTSGQVLLEGSPATEYALSAIRGAVCYVPQQPVLFSGTIRENLLYANANATEGEINIAVESAQLRSLLARLPHGLDTALGPEAVGLSGGERQRLALARALLRRSAVLVLDESTSALDLPTEQAIFRSIASVRADLALVVISHRLRSLTWVDRIVLLDSGVIVAQGTHRVLYRENALYRSLYEREGKSEDDHLDGDESDNPSRQLGQSTPEAVLAKANDFF